MLEREGSSAAASGTQKGSLTTSPASSLADSEKTHGKSTGDVTPVIGSGPGSGSELLENISKICSIIWEAKNEHQKGGSSLEAERMAVDRMGEVIRRGERVAAARVEGDTLEMDLDGGVDGEADGESKAILEVLEAGRMFCEVLGDAEGAGKVRGGI